VPGTFPLCFPYLWFEILDMICRGRGICWRIPTDSLTMISYHPSERLSVWFLANRHIDVSLFFDHEATFEVSDRTPMRYLWGLYRLCIFSKMSRSLSHGDVIDHRFCQEVLKVC
jgi:hypothetical protein